MNSSVYSASPQLFWPNLVSRNPSGSKRTLSKPTAKATCAVTIHVTAIGLRLVGASESFWYMAKHLHRSLCQSLHFLRVRKVAMNLAIPALEAHHTNPREPFLIGQFQPFQPFLLGVVSSHHVLNFLVHFARLRKVLAFQAHTIHGGLKCVDRIESEQTVPFLANDRQFVVIELF